jgi:DNA-binding XRE family transcriptional regulator
MGISQNVLAKKAGLSRAAIQHIEKGIRNPTLIICHAVASALDVSLADVLTLAEKQGNDEKLRS